MTQRACHFTYSMHHLGTWPTSALSARAQAHLAEHILQAAPGEHKHEHAAQLAQANLAPCPGAAIQRQHQVLAPPLRIVVANLLQRQEVVMRLP